ncbi:MAG: hypothetical protein R6V26_06585 [Roseovarius sp.]
MIVEHLETKAEEVPVMIFGGKPALARGALTPMAAAALALTMLSSPAAAATVVYEQVKYDLAFSGNGESFDSANNGFDLTDTNFAPWWANEDFARGLAEAYLAQNGVDDAPFASGGGDLSRIKFAYDESESPGFVNFAYVDSRFDGVEGDSSEAVDEGSQDTAFVYATSITPVPLPPAGIALGFGLFSLLGLRRWKARRTV